MYAVHGSCLNPDGLCQREAPRAGSTSGKPTCGFQEMGGASVQQDCCWIAVIVAILILKRLALKDLSSCSVLPSAQNAWIPA